MAVNINLNNVENSTNKRTTFQVTPDDTHYPSEKLVKDSLDGKQPTGSYATGTGSANGTNTGDETLATLHIKINTALDEPTILNTDKFPFLNGTLVTTTWVNIKGVLKTYFDSIYKATFSENTAFNKNFGTTSGTVCEGNDSRIGNNKNFITCVNGSHTGSTTETILNSHLIPANTMTANSMLIIDVQNYKSASVGSVSMLIKINTSLAVAGATLMSTLTTTNRDLPMYRRFFVNHLTAANNTRNNNSAGNSVVTDVQSGLNYAVSQRSVTVDWTVNQYIMITGTLVDTSETINNEMFAIQIIK